MADERISDRRITGGFESEARRLISAAAIRD